MINSKVKNKTAILQIFGYFPSSCLGMLFWQLKFQKKFEDWQPVCTTPGYIFCRLCYAWH